MTNTLDTPPAARETPKPRLGRLALLTILCVVAGLAVVAGTFGLYALHAEKVEARARHQAEIHSDRVAVIAKAAGHTVYAPAGWGAEQYPSVMYGPKVTSWGKYGAVTVHLWQVPARDILRMPSRARRAMSLATPESLCKFTARERRADRWLDAQLKTMACSFVPGSHARIRVFPNDPQPGSTDVRLALALPEKGRYLNLWAVDETGEIAEDPVAWATRFIKDLKPYDISGYSVEDIYQARDAADWFAS